ncbi:hypothetical protein [Zobellella endophytica]|uniref:hypothetical protein n=1 Tax=Zobellella endophytica TaxID=2116700 RepID=UPI0011B27044|nr:hypothetical protein [Zobellella endophytica]
MTRVTDENNFRAFYGSAMKIYEYIEMSQELSVSPWGFDAATFSDDGTITYAQFSCTSVSGWGKDQLTVIATENDGVFK